MPFCRLCPQFPQPGLGELKVFLIVRQGRGFLLQRRLGVILFLGNSGQRLLGSVRRIPLKLKGRLMRFFALLHPSLH